MRRFVVLAVLMAGFAVVPAALAGTSPYDGTSTVIARTATTVTVSYQQTVGPTVTVDWNHYCYAGGQLVGSETVLFTGSGVATFNVGPRKYRGKTYTPDYCFGYAEFDMPSQTAWIFAGVDTVGVGAYS